MVFGKEAPVLIKGIWVLSDSDMDVRHNRKRKIPNTQIINRPRLSDHYTSLVLMVVSSLEAKERQENAWHLLPSSCNLPNAEAPVDYVTCLPWALSLCLLMQLSYLIYNICVKKYIVVHDIYLKLSRLCTEKGNRYEYRPICVSIEELIVLAVLSLQF
jgi:hypothetical protein